MRYHDTNKLTEVDMATADSCSCSRCVQHQQCKYHYFNVQLNISHKEVKIHGVINRIYRFGPKIVCQKNSGCKSCRQPSASTFAALLKLLLIKLSQVIHLPVPRSISKYSINVLFSLVPHFPKLSAPVGLSVSLTHIWCFSSLNNTLPKNNQSSSSSLITE